MSIQTVGVVGAGVMGRGVSHALAESGHKVILLDLSEEILGSARNEIRSTVRMYSVFSKEKATTADAKKVTRMLSFPDVSILTVGRTMRREIKCRASSGPTPITASTAPRA